jgi:hypothetical protein
MSGPYQVVRRGKGNVRFEVANHLFFRLSTQLPLCGLVFASVDATN